MITTTPVDDATTAFSSFLQIPLNGYRHNQFVALKTLGDHARLWVRSADGTNGRILYIHDDKASFQANHRTIGFGVLYIYKE
jgi:hypothetical protein